MQFLLSLSLVYLMLFSACTSGDREHKNEALQTFNLSTNKTQDQPIVVLVSIDGYRHDYNEIHKPKYLNKIATEGARAKGLVPVFPSKTFPNHYSIVTGLYADQHGIVANHFYDPSTQKKYTLSDRSAVRGAEWYFGKPLWQVVQENGLQTASFFWVGSEAPINGVHPNYYYYYDSAITNAERVEQVVDWLKLPQTQRPHLITLYFDQVDSAGHVFGPEAKETQNAVLEVDQAIAKLHKEIRKMDENINLIIVSDHGMLRPDPKKAIQIDSSEQIRGIIENSFLVEGKGPLMNLYKKPKADQKTIGILEKDLEAEFKNIKVLNRVELKEYNYDSTDRVGDLVILADPGYSLYLGDTPKALSQGDHGWDPRATEKMNGIFFATGPAFKKATQVEAFENIHVYPLVLKVFGIDAPEGIDGKLEKTQGLLK